MRPKPLVEVGDRPILWHLMQNLSSWGMREFIIALGYKGEEIKRFFLDYQRLSGSITIDFSKQEPPQVQQMTKEWLLYLVETGLHSMTGGRVRNVAEQVAGRTFMMTYGDGLADVDISALIAFHRSHGRLATVTAVRPPARFGGLEFDGDKVTRFLEKPQTGEGWINGGFFILEPGVFIGWKNPSCRNAMSSPVAASRSRGCFSHTVSSPSM